MKYIAQMRRYQATRIIGIEDQPIRRFHMWAWSRIGWSWSDSLLPLDGHLYFKDANFTSAACTAYSMYKHLKRLQRQFQTLSFHKCGCASERRQIVCQKLGGDLARQTLQYQ